MYSPVSPPPPAKHRSTTRGHRRLLSPSASTAGRARRGAIRPGRPLARYFDARGDARELLAVPGHAGSVLVLDRDAATLCDRRLVAHLAADEPSQNAALICRHYLDDAHGRWCRRVRREDLKTTPFAREGHEAQADRFARDVQIADSTGNSYSLRPLRDEQSHTQLRWCQSVGGPGCSWRALGLRDVVAATESYEPVRTLTECAFARHRDDPDIALKHLRAEFERLCASPIVLNRGLREAVLDTIDRHGLSMSEIALRCGVVKYDRRGNPSGETSWLARRVGIMPEGGKKQVTPWVHSDVLAVIARQGLGISPREVELQ